MLEPYIKKKLIKKLAPGNVDTHTELGAGSCVADVVFLGDDKFTAFEIKSDGDTLKRFKQQKYSYLFTFDEVWLVVAKKTH